MRDGLYASKKQRMTGEKKKTRPCDEEKKTQEMKGKTPLTRWFCLKRCFFTPLVSVFLSGMEGSAWLQRIFEVPSLSVFRPYIFSSSASKKCICLSYSCLRFTANKVTRVFFIYSSVCVVTTSITLTWKRCIFIPPPSGFACPYLTDCVTRVYFLHFAHIWMVQHDRGVFLFITPSYVSAIFHCLCGSLSSHFFCACILLWC